MMKITYDIIKNPNTNENLLLNFYLSDIGQNEIFLNDEQYNKLFIEKEDVVINNLVFNIIYLEPISTIDEIKSLNKLNQEQQNIINTYVIRLVQNSSIFTDVEKESLWKFVDNFDNATLKEIELNNILYPEELSANDYIIDNEYNIGDIFWFEDKLYKVIQKHISRSFYLPQEVPALYRVIATRDTAGQIKNWVQPTGAHDAYSIGEVVLYNNNHYRSKINGNTTVPGLDDRWWELI